MSTRKKSYLQFPNYVFLMVLLCVLIVDLEVTLSPPVGTEAVHDATISHQNRGLPFQLRFHLGMRFTLSHINYGRQQSNIPSLECLKICNASNAWYADRFSLNIANATTQTQATNVNAIYHTDTYANDL